MCNKITHNKTTITIYTECLEAGKIDFEQILYLITASFPKPEYMDGFAGVFSSEPEKWLMTMGHEDATW